MGFEHDVLTDHLVHREGVELLNKYRVLLTGSHPEYWTEPLWKAVQAYLAQGGRAMYLGGNGMYWVISNPPVGSSPDRAPARALGYGGLVLAAGRGVHLLDRGTERSLAQPRPEPSEPVRSRFHRRRI